MKKRITIPGMLLIACLCIATTFIATYSYFLIKPPATGSDGFSSEKLDAVVRLYNEGYIHDIDPTEVENGIINGYIAGTGDKYGTYYIPEMNESIQSEFTGTTVGIGIVGTWSEEKSAVLVVSVTKETGADEAGILPNDYITNVDGEETKDLGWQGTVNRLRGEEGTVVNVTIDRNEAILEFSITRKKFEAQSVTGHLIDGTKIGYVSISTFDATTYKQFSSIIDQLEQENAEALIFDIRDNGGGELNAIVSVLDRILPEGPTLLAKYKEGETVVVGSSDSTEIDLPIAVLINGNTASAAELFAGDLHDFGKGVLIGTHTYGKWEMQSFIEFPDKSILRYTIAEFKTGYGNSYSDKGISPDIEVAYDRTSGIDEQLEAAIDYLENDKEKGK